MLERRHRLTTSAGFTTATRRGRRAGTRTLVGHLASSSSPAPEATTGPQVGFVVSRAVGNAVTRNRVKRRLRHLVRDRIGSLPPDGLLVVRALPASAAASYPGLGRDLDTVLSRLGITADQPAVGPAVDTP
jgi:ribonuclease P protein component